MAIASFPLSGFQAKAMLRLLPSEAPSVLLTMFTAE